jgi:hypothetical protein
MNSKLIGIGTVIITILFVQLSHAWESKIIYRDNNGKLVYISDSEGNRIPDFSHAGYKGGGVPIPDIPIVKTISAIEGDNTTHIQNALFEMSFLPKDSDGFRGALLLTAGKYEIRGTINFGFDGVVLRGVGDGDDPASNTILWATGNSPNQRTVLVAGGGAATKWREEVSNSRTNITSDSVMAGSNVFELEDASKFSIGDNIIIFHPCTAEWLAAIDSGGTFWYLPGAEPGVDLPWDVGSQPIVFNRHITGIQGTTITIDVPVFNHLIRSIAQSYIYKYSRSGLRTQIGIENLRIDIETAGGADEAHAWNAIDLFQIEDAWVRDCTMLHFGHSGVRTNTATRITVENCEALDPVSEIDGERRYNFNVYTASQQVLFKNCRASNGRHHYVSNGTSWTSGCVFLDCTSEGAYTSSEGHRRWSMGLLYDNLIELDGPRPGYNPRLLGIYNRGYYGSSHGWGLAHSVAWNCDMAGGDLIVQQPPTAQNFAIGCKGKNVTGKKPPAPFEAPDGYIEGTNESGLEPCSLYEAQLDERLATQVSIGHIAPDPVQKPVSFSLHQNFPNPFNSNTNIKFDVFKTGFFTISIYNLKGEKIQILASENFQQGSHQVQFQAKDLSSGIYFVKMQSNSQIEVKRVVLLN